MNQVFWVDESTTHNNNTTSPKKTKSVPPDPISDVAQSTLLRLYQYLKPAAQAECCHALEAQISRFPDTSDGLLN